MSRLKAIRARRSLLVVLGALLIAGVTGFALQSGQSAQAGATPDNSLNTTTPIKHLVVIYDENISFDHYFGTYPYATNTDGTPFHAAANTPTDINTELNAGMLPGNELSSVNPNGSQPTTSTQYTSPNPNEYQPQRLGDSQAVTCDQDHSYGPEQAAENAGAMNAFVQNTYQSCSTTGTYDTPGLNMDYYDGNTVAAMWNYAQNYAMSDNNWDTVFGPSTPGALNVISGNTASGNSSGTINADVDPNGDSFGTNAANQTPTMSGANVGDLLNDKGVSWGWFQGGFASESESHSNVIAAAAEDYSAHHDPFQYYASTKNWAHTAPASGAEVGNAGSANHQYDISDFNDIFSDTAIDGSVPTLPAVSYLKAPEAQDAHAGYSDPLDEQEWLTTEINQIEQSPYWDSTAIVITYDDTDGWYDHQAPVITNSSSGASGDAAVCTNPQTEGVPEIAGDTGRCGPSQRIPLVVISPYAKQNYVSHVETDQVSVPKFIEQNWDTGDIDSISSVPGSFDTSVNGLDDMFDFTGPQHDQVLLNSTMYTAGKTSGENNINPEFGAVASTPADSVAPTSAPKISVNQQTLTLPVGTPLPSDQTFRSEIGASITSGSLSDNFETTVNPDQVGSYQVSLSGSIASTDAGTPDTVSALDPATITVNVAAPVSLSNSKLYFNEGAAPTSSYISSVAGATVAGGVVSPIDLSSVDFGTPGVYQVQVDGKVDGVAATPATLTIVVEGTGVPLGQPVVSLNQNLLTYGVGDDPTPASVTAAAGASITHGVLDPLDFSGASVDFNVAGTYTVPVTGADAGDEAIPATLTIVVVPVPVVTAALPTIETPVGDVLTSDQVVLDSEASSSEGQIAPVYLSNVNWNKVGQYTVQLSAAYEAIASATTQPVTIDVVPAAGNEQLVTPSTTALMVTRTAADLRRGAVTATVKVSARDKTPTGRVSLYAGSKLLKTVALKRGRATATLDRLPSGTDRLHAGYLGNRVVHSSLSGTASVVLAQARSQATVDLTPARGSDRATFRIAVTAAGNTPTGQVALRAAGRLIRRVELVKGRAAVTVHGLPAHIHVQVVYLGSHAVRGSSSRNVAVVYPSKTTKTKRGAR